jgi:hypothetical protein
MNQSSFRFNDSYYLDSLPYSSYNTNSYPFRQQTHHPHSTSSNVYFSSSSSSSTSQLPHSDVPLSYPNYDSTYLNVAVAAAYQNGYQNHYHNNTIADSFDLNFSRHMNKLYGNNNNNNEQQIETNIYDRKVSTSKKRKFQDETMSIYLIFL